MKWNLTDLRPEPDFEKLANEGASLDDLTEEQLDKYLRLSYENYRAGVLGVDREAVMNIVDWIMARLKQKPSPKRKSK